MKVKQGVVREGLRPEMLFALGFIEAVYRLHGPREPTLTSGLDGTHSPNSLHYSGRAVDIRTRTLSRQTAQEIVKVLRATLDPLGFDTVLEENHVHCEFDPKGEERVFTEGVA